MSPTPWDTPPSTDTRRGSRGLPASSLSVPSCAEPCSRGGLAVSTLGSRRVATAWSLSVAALPAQAALKLARLPVDVTLIDRRNFHLFQPLVYQVATGALSPAEISYPLRRIFRRRPNVQCSSPR